MADKNMKGPKPRPKNAPKKVKQVGPKPRPKPGMMNEMMGRMVDPTKTISDADRQRVEQIVGQLGLIEDPKTLQNALKEVYELIVVEGKRNVQEGLTNLNFYTNKSAPKKQSTYVDVVGGSDGIFDVRRSGT